MKKIKTLTKAYRILLVLLLTGSFLALGSQAVMAAVMPGYSFLGTVADQAAKPTTVGIDMQGRVYIGGNKRVSIFTQSGHYVATIRLSGNPNTIAVDASGKIFIGTSDTGIVTVYGPDLQSIGILGNGSGPDFGKYFDVAVDNAGNVYVADKGNNAVHVYNGSSRTLTATLTVLGTTGTGALHHPISVTVDEAASELIILDRQKAPDSSSRSPWIDGVGVHVFKIATDATAGTQTWTWDRSFGTFGKDRDSGDVKHPAQVAVDGQGRIYVLAKLIVPVTMVYSNIGEYLGNIKVAGRNDMAISSSNLMYVVSYKGRNSSISVYGLDNFSAAIVAPSPIAYQAIVGGNTPQAQTITIENKGNTALDWTASSDTAWIALAAVSGTLDPAAATPPLDIPVVLDGLAAGSYEGTVSVVTAGGVTDQVKVTLTIAPNPLVVTPATIPLSSTVGTPPTSQTIKVTYIGNAPLDWTATADQAWIALSPASGTAPSEVSLTVDVADLAAGIHEAIITFVRTGDDPGPVTVAVTLTLTGDGTEPPPVVGPELPAPGSKGIKVAGKVWRVTQVPGLSDNLRGVWGTGPRNIMVVGDNGTIRRFNGKKWKEMDTGTAALYSVWGSAKDNVYAVGDAGTILHFNGKEWTAVISGTELLEDVFGTTDTTVVAVGSLGAVVDADNPGASVDSSIPLRSIWGTTDDKFYAVGGQGTVVRYDGAASTFEINKETGTKEMLNSVWGRSDTDVFAVGENGTILHKDEKGWTKMVSGTTENLLGVWGNSKKDVYAVGANATVLHYNGSKWSTLFTGGENNVQLHDIWASHRGFVVAVGDGGTILTARKARFPWNTVIRNIVSVAQKKEKETVKK